MKFSSTIIVSLQVAGLAFAAPAPRPEASATDLAHALDKDLFIAGWGQIKYDEAADALAKRTALDKHLLVAGWGQIKYDEATSDLAKRTALDKNLLVAGWGQIKYDDASSVGITKDKRDMVDSMKRHPEGVSIKPLTRRDPQEANLFGWLITVLDYTDETGATKRSPTGTWKLAVRNDALSDSVKRDLAKREVDTSIDAGFLGVWAKSDDDTAPDAKAKRDDSPLEANLFGWLITVLDYTPDETTAASSVAKRDDSPLEANLFGWLITVLDYKPDEAAASTA